MKPGRTEVREVESISERQHGEVDRPVEAGDVQEAAIWQRQGVPVPSGRCFGREAAQEDVLRLFEQPGCRLVTLTGSPGVGKTRLALALAEQAPDRLHCPLCWVSLAALASPDALADALVTAFELPSAPPEESLATLHRFVANREVLLVLDNFEHLMPHACRLLTDLLAHAPLLKCLVTSRAPLRIPGEWIYPVSPLIVPPEVENGREPPRPPGSLLGYPSVQLFVERARAADPVWQVTEANAAAVAAFCRALDGLPLAIELTAAQVRALTVEEMLRQWEGPAEERLALLEDPSERGLWHALGVWFARLTPAAQRLLADLSVCAGDFSRGAAEAIGEAQAGALRELVEANWLHKSEAEGHSRYGILETIRAFAGEQRRHRCEGAERRHGEHFLQVARSAAALWHTPRDVEALRTVARDWPNVRRGFRWARERGEDAWVCAYARAVLPFLTHRSWSREGAGWTEAWLAAAERGGDARERCRAMVAFGEALRVIEETERSQAMLWEGLALARELDEPRGVGEALWSLSEHIRRETHPDNPDRRALLAESLLQFRRAGDLPAQARVLAQLPGELPEALQLYRALGSTEGQLVVLRGMANQCSRRGAAAEGRRLLEEALALAEAAGMAAEVLPLLVLLGRRSVFDADQDGAARCYHRCWEVAQRVGNLYHVARAQDSLAGVLLTRGEPHAARPLLEESYRIFLRLNHPRASGDVLLTMAECARQMGDVIEAERLLRHSLEVHRGRDSDRSAGVALWLLGQLYRQTRRYDEAAQSLEESLRHCRRTEVLLELGTVAHERGDLPSARRWWIAALGEPEHSVPRQFDLIRALQEIGRMAATSGDPDSALLLGVAAREMQAAGAPEAAAAARDASAALKLLGQGARAVRRQIARTTLEEALAQARLWLEQEDERPPTNDHRPPATDEPVGSSVVGGRSSVVAAPLRVYLLGRFEAWRYQERIASSEWGRPKAAALFQWLCLQGGRRVSREEAIEALWGDLPGDRAAPNLATTLSMLRRALGSLATSCLRSEGDTIQLALGEAVWVDAAAFEQHVSAAQRCRRAADTAGMARHSRAALALYEGDLLPGEPLSEWVLPLRQRLAGLRLSALVTLAEDALAHGDPQEAGALAEQALQQDACEESAVRVQMQALARQGKRTEALRCFEQLCQALRREFDAAPEEETLRLFHHLRLASR